MIMRISFMCNIKFFFNFYEPTSLICFRQRSCLTPTRIKQQLKKQLDPSLVDCLKQEYRFRPVLHLRKNTAVSTLLLFSQCNKKNVVNTAIFVFVPMFLSNIQGYHNRGLWKYRRFLIKRRKIFVRIL